MPFPSSSPSPSTFCYSWTEAIVIGLPLTLGAVIVLLWGHHLQRQLAVGTAVYTSLQVIGDMATVLTSYHHQLTNDNDSLTLGSWLFGATICISLGYGMAGLIWPRWTLYIAMSQFVMDWFFKLLIVCTFNGYGTFSTHKLPLPVFLLVDVVLLAAGAYLGIHLVSLSSSSPSSVKNCDQHHHNKDYKKEDKGCSKRMILVICLMAGCWIQDAISGLITCWPWHQVMVYPLLKVHSTNILTTSIITTNGHWVALTIGMICTGIGFLYQCYRQGLPIIPFIVTSKHNGDSTSSPQRNHSGKKQQTDYPARHNPHK